MTAGGGRTTDLADAVFDLPVSSSTTVRVGLVICADLMWRQPLFALKQLGVTHFAAPALWYDGTTPTLAQFQAVSGVLKSVLIGFMRSRSEWNGFMRSRSVL